MPNADAPFVGNAEGEELLPDGEVLFAVLFVVPLRAMARF